MTVWLGLVVPISAFVTPVVRQAWKLDALGEDVRGEFPALQQKVGSEQLIYFDSGATSQTPQRVLDVYETFYTRDKANVHRGAHTLANRATEAYEEARDKVARLVNADRNEIVWTRGATEALNLVAWSFGDRLGPGDEIVLTVAEHHANVVPWQLLASRKGAVVKYARLDSSQRVDVEHLTSLVNKNTKIIGLHHISNVLGCAGPVGEAVALARTEAADDCVVVLDACQSVPHMPVDVQALGVDFLVASGHKMLGPTGIGFLWGRRAALESMPPWHGGGEMIDKVTLEGTTFLQPPMRFEAGTPPIAQAIALGAACDYVRDVGLDNIKEYEQELAKHLYDGIADIPGAVVYGPRDRATALVAFNIPGIHPSDLAFFLDQEGVAVRSGHHCAQPLHTELDAEFGSVRASLALYNTHDEIDAFLGKLKGCIDFLSEPRSRREDELFVPLAALP